MLRLKRKGLKTDSNQFLVLFSRGRRNRTLVDGFGDRCSTAELCPFIQFIICTAEYYLNAIFLTDEKHYNMV